MSLAELEQVALYVIVGAFLLAICMRLFYRGCKHEFVLADIELTNIEPPKKPDGGATQAEWDKYYHALYNGDHHKKRVKWPCRKCKEVFYAHCGLDISPENGPTVLP